MALRPHPSSHPLSLQSGEVRPPVSFGDEEVAFGGLDDQRVTVIGPGLGPPTLRNAPSEATGGRSGVTVKCSSSFSFSSFLNADYVLCGKIFLFDPDCYFKNNCFVLIRCFSFLISSLFPRLFLTGRLQGILL